MSSEKGTQSDEPSEVPSVVPKVREGFGSSNTFPSLKGVFELLKEGTVVEPGFNSLKAFTTLAEVLSSPIKGCGCALLSHKRGFLS